MKIYRKSIEINDELISKFYNPYNFHRDIEKLFNRKNTRPYKCFCVEISDNKANYTIYSEFDSIDSSINFVEFNEEILNKIFAVNNELGFRTVYNPGCNIKVGDKVKVRFNKNVDQTIRSKLKGFEVLEHDNKSNRHHYLNGKDNHKVACFKVSGKIKVVNTQDAINTFVNGIGREKYLGLGLIQIFA